MHPSLKISCLPAEGITCPYPKTGCQSRVLPNIRQCQGYAAAGGGMAVILSLICTMSNLDNPESVGLRVAAAMGGVFLAMLLSQGLFVYLRYSFSENANK